jgi:hypothetical protein
MKLKLEAKQAAASCVDFYWPGLASVLGIAVPLLDTMPATCFAEEASSSSLLML